VGRLLPKYPAGHGLETHKECQLWAKTFAIVPGLRPGNFLCITLPRLKILSMGAAHSLVSKQEGQNTARRLRYTQDQVAPEKNPASHGEQSGIMNLDIVKYPGSALKTDFVSLSR
jgi:hypothetical protein